eukprot:9663616-Alexandrium_andersonii.AAC.1
MDTCAHNPETWEHRAQEHEQVMIAPMLLMSVMRCMWHDHGHYDDADDGSMATVVEVAVEV